MECRSGIHTAVLIMLVCAIFSPGSCVRRLDPPRLEDADRFVKGYLLPKTVSTPTFAQDAPGSIPLAEYIAQRSTPVAYTQFWLDLLNAMKSMEERGDLNATSRRLETTGMPLKVDSSNVSLPNNVYLEPVIAVDGNRTGMLLLVEEDGHHVMDDASRFPADGMQEEEPHLLLTADSQFEQAPDDDKPMTDETTTTLASTVSETVTPPILEFGEKFTPLTLTEHTPNVVLDQEVEYKQLALKRSNRVARVKRNAVIEDESSNVWHAVHNPTEAYKVRLVNSGFRNPFIPISEGQRPSNDAVQGGSATADEAGLIRTAPNDGTARYSLFHTFGPQGPDNVAHHTTATKGVGGTFHPQEDKKMHLPEHHQHRYYSVDSTDGNQTYLHEEFPPGRKANVHQDEGARGAKRTLEDQHPPPGGIQGVSSSRFDLKIPNTKDGHLNDDEDQSEGPVNVEVSSSDVGNDDVGKPDGFHWRAQQFVSYDDDNFDSGYSKISSPPMESEGFPSRRSARRIWTPSLRSSMKSDARRHDDEMEGGEQPSALRTEPADVFDNEIEGDEHKTAGGGPGAGQPQSVVEQLLDRLERCLRAEALSALERLEAADQATLWPGVQLVRAGHGGRFQRQGHSSRSSPLEGDEDERWAATAVDRLANLMRTHVIRLNLTPPADDERDQGRRIRYRHQYKHMFPLVVMGYMVMSSFLVPLGFQLMAVLSGKALLLSKMALAVAGMAGFKRLFLAGLGPDYPPPAPAVLHHETYPVYHEHHASFVK